MKTINISTVICCIFLIFTAAFSQNNKFNILHVEKTFGRNYINDAVITGKEIIFPERIHKAFLDTTTHYLTVQLRDLTYDEKYLRNTGVMLQYDLTLNKVLWSENISYLAEDFMQFNNLLIHKISNRTRRLDVKTGKELWSVDNHIFAVDPTLKFGLGYKHNAWSGGYTNELEGISMTNGTRLWKRKINSAYGYNDLFYINDYTLLAIASGLHAINIITGEGWDYNAMTGKNQYEGMASNVLIDSAFIYFASKDQIVKLDKHTGKIEWKNRLQYESAKSLIFMNDSVVYMINYAYAFFGVSQSDIGSAFVAAFDRQTGKQRYFSFSTYNYGAVKGFKILEKEIILLFRNRVVKYDMNTGTKISEKKFLKKEFGQIRYFVGNRVFITNNNGDLVNLAQSDSTKMHFYTSQNEIVSIDNQLNVIDRMDFDSTGIYFLRYNDYKFIVKDKKTYVINNEGKTVAEIEITTNAFIIDNILYDRKEKSFITINLKTLLL